MRARSTTVGEHHEAYNVGFSTIGIPTTDPPLTLLTQIQIVALLLCKSVLVII